MICDMGEISDRNKGHGDFLKPMCDMEKNERQRHATLEFLNIDMGHGTLPSTPPLCVVQSGYNRGNYAVTRTG